MTRRESTEQSGSVPGRKWYAVAVLIFLVGMAVFDVWYAVAVLVFLVGMAVFAVFLIRKLSKLGDDFVRVTVPGQAELTFDPGTYTIFHEQGGTTDGTDGVVIAGGNITGLRVSVQRPDCGAAIPLTADAAGRYSIGSRSGQALFTFTLTEPGTYRLVAAYDDGRHGPQAVLAIARGFVEDLLKTIFAGFAIVFGSVAIAAAIVISVSHRRRSALAPPSPV